MDTPPKVVNLPATTSLLDIVQTPTDIRGMNDEQLKQLADELRAETIRAVSHTGGHLGAGLGVVELTVALHHVFNTPDDKLIWDVGHQTYPHKILTGRRDRIRTLRQPGGLAGFCKRDESVYDAFGAGHSSTSISAALGMAKARDMSSKNHEVIAVIGDGAMSAGMAFEALNNAGSLGTRMIVILNDNDMSIAPPVGAMSSYLSRMVSSHQYRSLRHFAKVLANKFPAPLARAAKNAEKYMRGMATGGTMFEELGFYYVGPVDGHNLDHLLPILRNIHNEKESGPVLLHVVTQKGHGYAPAEASDDKYHGVTTFDVSTGTQKKAIAGGPPSYTKVFANALIAEAEADDKIVAITAAMPSGTGLDIFEKRFADRTFDVGIAEQHAVTFAAGLAAEGYKPFCAIYSTFLQRAYDQVVHDVAVQKLPVRFAVDRAGLVGADGPTHAGSFDIASLAALPHMVIMAPADEAELMHMVATSASINSGPSVVRYPRGDGIGVALPTKGEVLPIGIGRTIRKGNTIALLSLGTRLQECMKAADELEKMGLSATVADARFAKPLDAKLIQELVSTHDVLITVEEGSTGGFGAHVLTLITSNGWLDGSHCNVRTLCLPDEFMEQGIPHAMYEAAGLNASGILKAAQDALKKTDMPLSVNSAV